MLKANEILRGIITLCAASVWMGSARGFGNFLSNYFLKRREQISDCFVKFSQGSSCLNLMENRKLTANFSPPPPERDNFHLNVLYAELQIDTTKYFIHCLLGSIWQSCFQNRSCLLFGRWNLLRSSKYFNTGQKSSLVFPLICEGYCHNYIILLRRGFPRFKRKENLNDRTEDERGQALAFLNFYGYDVELE